MTFDLSRRRAIRYLAAGGVSFYLTGIENLGASASRWLASPSRGELKTASGADFNPIDRTQAEHGERKYSGDSPDRGHRLIRDKDSFLRSIGGKIPDPSEKVPLVIVGGGMSGILSAYLLRDLKPVVLERADRFGGNSRGESWRGMDYSLGAAYATVPDSGSRLAQFYSEIGFDRIATIRASEDPVEINETICRGFWDGKSDPARAKEFKKLKKHFLDVLNERDGLKYPVIPPADAEMAAYVKKLDQVSFKTHLESVVGGPLHPHALANLQHYCWASFDAGIEEVSAAAGLNFYAGEFGRVQTAPGGNAAIAELALKKILKSVPRENLRPGAVVFDVHAREDGVVIAYEDNQGQIRSIEAKALILACPKFVVSRILRGIEPDRAAAIGRIRYRSYLVANVLLSAKSRENFYDLYVLGDGTLPSPKANLVDDVVLGNFARPSADHTVLSLYRGLPWDGGRAEISDPLSYEKVKAELEAGIQKLIRQVTGSDSGKIADIRITRWGHPFPVARVGQISGGIPQEISKPFGRNVFFVNQDNWLHPAIETAAAEAFKWEPEVRKALARKPKA